jgi:DNA-binding NtrC family response regulator
VRDAWGYLLRDLESTNGTYLDGAEIREAYIRSGSVITAGQTKVKFRTQEDILEVTAYPDEVMGPLVGRSPTMRLVFGAVNAIADLEIPVLFYGEHGTGRRTLAALLHRMSLRRSFPLVEVNCTTTPLSELEETLFDKPGGGNTIVLPLGGTLVLVDPWDLSMEFQSRMVKALESGRGARRGTDRPVESVRVVTVTSRDLSAEVERGKMDTRLASHLAAVQIQIPPLRKRPQDVDALLEKYMDIALSESPQSRGLPEVLQAAFRSHSWPGNVPELQLFVDSWLTAMQTHSGSGLMALLDTGPDDPLAFRHHKRQWVDTFERHFLTRLMNKCQGNVSQAARLAGMDRKYLNNLLKRHGIKE